MTKRKIPLTWVKHLKDKQEQQDLEDLLRNTTRVLSRLRDILNEMEESTQRVREIDYNDPSWSHRQAHLNGERDAIRKIKDLINFIP